MSSQDPFEPGICVLDANVFMRAYRDTYHPDVFPGFWDWLKEGLGSRQFVSIDRVQSEIKNPKWLVDWAAEVPDQSFASSADRAIVSVYSQIQAWVQSATQFQPAAKNQFAQGADAWLVAFAYVRDGVVVTQEVFDPNIRRRVPIPNVCKEFGVEYQNTMQFLAELNPRFVLENPVS